MKRSILFIALCVVAMNVKSNPDESGLLSGRLVFFTYFYSTSYEYMSCKFIEKGLKGKKSFYNYRGKLTKNKDFCRLRIDTKEFEENFLFCALSGYNSQVNGPGVCSFGRADDAYVFLAGRINNEKGSGGQICQFVCRTTGKRQDSKK